MSSGLHSKSFAYEYFEVFMDVLFLVDQSDWFNVLGLVPDLWREKVNQNLAKEEELKEKKKKEAAKIKREENLAAELSNMVVVEKGALDFKDEVAKAINALDNKVLRGKIKAAIVKAKRNK